MQYNLLTTLFIALVFFACQPTEKDTNTTSATECDECLSSGGTWQIDECTSNCAIQDISCYTDECPPPCSESCSGCFSESECTSAGCEWEWDEYSATCKDTD